MELRLVRKTKTSISKTNAIPETIGELYVDGVFECYTLEDEERKLGEKVYGRTAIPCGTYKVIIDRSERFQCNMPHVLDVPGFAGVRIHAGNTDADTLGCILVGQEKGREYIGKSRAAYDKLFKKLSESKSTVNLTIVSEVI